MIADLGIIIAAGGSGSRFGAQNKLLAELGAAPVLLHSIREFSGLCPEGHLVLVASEAAMPEYKAVLEKAGFNDSVRLVIGGDHRMRSVQNGLRALPLSAKYAAIHDAARPFASAALLLRCLDAARRHGGAIAAKRVTDTVKLADSALFCAETLDRERLWTVETPQVFEREPLLAAYERAEASGEFFTDDAGAFARAGRKVFLLENPDFNLKITYPNELLLAQAWLSSRAHSLPD